MARGGLRAELLLFDLDGVLVDSREPISASIAYALRCLGVAGFPREQLQACIGEPLHDVFVRLLEARGADPRAAERCIEAYREHYSRVALRDTQLVPGIAALLERVRAGRRLGVATSKPVEFARPILDSLGVLGCFEAVVGPALDVREPKTRTVERALERLGVHPASAPVVLVGDTRFDMQAARAHGITAVGVTWGIGAATELLASGASHLVETPEALGALLEESA